MVHGKVCEGSKIFNEHNSVLSQSETIIVSFRQNDTIMIVIK